MNRITTGWLVAGLVVLGLVGCRALERAAGPDVRTEFLLEAPITPDGQRCTANCEQRRAYCRQKSDLGYADTHKQCEEQARNDYDNCVGRTTSFSEKSACYRKSCPVSASYISCEATFRGCFEGCGGKVWSREVCEKGC